MSNTQTSYAEINGARIYYETAGSGETVTFVHAGVADRRLWDAQFEAFAPRYRLIRYDLRGYGQTTAPAMSYSHADDLSALLDHLGVERTALVGCSMGGTAALDALLARPARVSALVMVCSVPSGYMPEGAPPPLILELIAAHQAGDAEAMADVAVKLWGVGENRDPEMVDSNFKTLMREMSLIGFRNQLAGLGMEQAPAAPALGRLGEVRVPALIIDGVEDHPTTHTAGEIMAAQIVGARHVMLPDTAHLPSLERPAEFNRILGDFLDSVLKS